MNERKLTAQLLSLSLDEEIPRELESQLLALLLHTDSRFRLKATNLISELGPRATFAIIGLQKLFSKEKSEPVLEGALLAIGAIGSSAQEAIPDLINFLEGPFPEKIKRQAAKSLGQIGASTPIAIPPLLR